MRISGILVFVTVIFAALLIGMDLWGHMPLSESLATISELLSDIGAALSPISS